MRPVHEGDPDRYEVVCCGNFIDAPSAPIAWAPYHVKKGWDIAAASRNKDDVEAFLEPGSNDWKARALYAAPQNNPGAALAEPTTVAADLDNGNARPNRKLDSSDRGHSRVGAQAAGMPSFQTRVDPWLMECFGLAIARDILERNHRFLEEALELVQANGCTVGEAHQLVDYVYGRDQGEINQEVGGVMVTLAALCLASGVDMHEAAETELARVWTKVEKIRAKHFAKPKFSPLPGPSDVSRSTAKTVDAQAGPEQLWSASKHDEIIKRLMADIGHPNSQSIYGAFKQFANELHALTRPSSISAGTIDNILSKLDQGAAYQGYPEGFGFSWTKLCGDAATIIRRLRTSSVISTEGRGPADEIIGQIEERFPDWRGFRDLVDCIDVTLHRLRGGS